MIQILKQNGEVPYGINEYVVDTKAEMFRISKNVSMGSSVFVVEENKTYILNGKKEWVEKLSANISMPSEDYLKNIPIIDNGNYFNATNVEDALQEIGATLKDLEESLKNI